MHVEPPPHEEAGDERLFRVIYIIDVNAADAQAAAMRAYEIMSDPDSMSPVLHVLDHAGNLTVIDLADGTTQPPA